MLNDTTDGLIIIELKDNISNYTMLIANCYVAPVNSNWNNIDEIYQEVTSTMYSHASYDAVYLMADFNARIGNLDDFIGARQRTSKDRTSKDIRSKDRRSKTKRSKYQNV